MVYISLLFFALCYLYSFEPCLGHGYLADPPARSSAWLFDSDFKSCCTYYDHTAMYCGATYLQWIVNGGKCSICGEPYNGKDNLFGKNGSMYLGKIVRTYLQGSTIPVTVVLTANHLGLFEFRVCSIDETPTEDATQSCLDLNLLHIDNGSTEYQIQSTFITASINVTLPANLTCQHCVFQWKYITGNSWGKLNGTSCLGCGRENEEFYGCSDISIVNEIVSMVQPATIPIKEPSRQCRSALTFSSLFDLSGVIGQYCQSVCSNNCAFDKKKSSSMIYDGCLKSCKELCIC